MHKKKGIYLNVSKMISNCKRGQRDSKKYFVKPVHPFYDDRF